MENTRLIKFLKSLNNNEIRQFRDFINSPVFNKNKNIVDLFEILKDYYPNFDTEEVSEEKLFTMVFKEENFEYFRIKNLTSDLFKLGKEFLAFNVYRNSQNTKEIFMLQELRLRNLDTAFEQTHRLAEKRLEMTEAKDENYFLHKMNLQFEIMSYYSPKKPNVNFHYMQERLDLFINYSLIFLIKEYNIMLHENNQNNYNFDLKMFDNVMSYLEKNRSTENPTLEVYYNILLMEKTKNEKYFYKLMELKNKYRGKLTDVDNYMLYLHLDGYCATAYNVNGRTDLLKEQFSLAKEFPVSDFTENGKILYPDFLNQVKKAVRVNEFEWAEYFMEKFKNKLTDEKDNTLNFCHGIIAYKKGDFDNALDLFSKTNFSNFIIKIQVKILLLQLFIDKKYYDQAELMIDTFRRYLTREKSILESIKISTMEFLKISGDLIKIKASVSGKELAYKIDMLNSDIDNMSNNRFGIKLYLKEKANDLKLTGLWFTGFLFAEKLL